LKAGVAARVTPDDVLICPYVFREVCRNGLLVTLAGEARQVERVSSESECGSARFELHAAVEACLRPEAFATIRKQITHALTRPAVTGADFLAMLAHGLHGQQGMETKIWRQIDHRFRRGGDESVFGLVNAVTSVARDQRDPHLRWRLEELGGGVLARIGAPLQVEFVREHTEGFAGGLSNKVGNPAKSHRNEMAVSPRD
jgi:hypothetical protein